MKNGNILIIDDEEKLRNLFGRIIKAEIVVGVIDVKDERVETPDVVAGRIRSALKHVRAEKLFISPDCGMKFMPRDRAFGKLKAMVEGTRIVRKELGGA